MSGPGLAQALAFAGCACWVGYMLGLSRSWKEGRILVFVGALFVVPTLIAGVLLLSDYSLAEIVFRGEAGITFAVPLGIGAGFIVSGAGALLYRRDSSGRSE